MFSRGKWLYIQELQMERMMFITFLVNLFSQHTRKMELKLR